MADFLINTLQPKLVAQFARVIDRHQLAQSYLFVGPKGAGKLALAECAYFASMSKTVLLVASVLSASAS